MWDQTEFDQLAKFLTLALRQYVRSQAANNHEPGTFRLTFYRDDHDNMVVTRDFVTSILVEHLSRALSVITHEQDAC
jgi:hypothetical protein